MLNRLEKSKRIEEEKKFKVKETEKDKDVGERISKSNQIIKIIRK